MLGNILIHSMLYGIAAHEPKSGLLPWAKVNEFLKKVLGSIKAENVPYTEKYT